MAATKEQREIEIVMNGQKVNASLKEMGASAALMNNQLRKMAADDPGREKLKGDFSAMRDRISSVKQELYGVEKATLAAKLGFNDMGGLMKTVMGTAGGLLLGGGIESLVGKVIGFFGDSSTAAKDFETSLSSLSAITGATGDELRFYEEQAQLIGQTTSLSATQAVEAFKLIGSAKPELLANKEALAAVTQEAIALAEASGMDLPEAANSLASSLNQFNAGAEESGRFINVLAAGAKEGSSEIAETAAALKNAGTVASGANLSFEETNAAIQALAEISIKGGEAGTGLRNVLLTLQSGADDTNPAVVGLETALDNLGKKNLSTAELAKLFGKENVVVANQLVNSREKIADLTVAMTGTSTAYEQAATNMDNLEGDVKSLDSATESLQIGIGKGLNVAIREGVKFLTALVLTLKEAPNFVRENKDLFITLGVAIAALNLANIKAAASAIAQTAAEKGRAIATKSSAAAQWVLNAAMSANPIGVVIALIAGLVGGFVMLYNRSEKVRGAVNGIWESMQQLGRNIKEIATAFLSGDITAIMSAFKNIGSGVGDAYSKGYQEKLAQEKAKQKKKEEAEHQQAKQKAEDEGKDLGKATADGFAASLKGKNIGQLEAMLEEETDAAHKKLIQKQLTHLKEVEKKEKEHREKLKKAREEYNDAVAKSELENAKLKIELMEDGVDRVLAKLRFQHEQEIEEIQKQQSAVLANVAATEEEKQVLLDQYAEQQRMKEEALKLAEEEARAADKEKKKEEYFTQLEEEEEYQALALEEQFLRAFDAEAAREQALVELHKQTLDQKLAHLQAAGQGETAEALRIKNELIKIEKEKTDTIKKHAKMREDAERDLTIMRVQLAGDALDGVMGFMNQESDAYKIFLRFKKMASTAEVILNLEKEVAANNFNAVANPLATLPGMGPILLAQAQVLNTMAKIRAGVSVAKIMAFERGGMTRGGRTIPMAEISGMWQMAGGHSGGSIGAFADGGWVNDAQLGLIGERGRELVIPNWMVESPKYANLVGYLEAERQKGIRAFADGGMTSGSAPALSVADSESRPLSRFETQLLQKFDTLTEEVLSWPNRLEVHNNVGETRDKLQLLNDLEERASG